MDDRVDKAFRRAYQAVLDRAPPAPEWDELDAPAPLRAAPPSPPRRRLSAVPRRLAGLAAALAVLALIGGVGLLVGERPEEAANPSVTGPPPAPDPTVAPSTTAAIPFVADPPAEPQPMPVSGVQASSSLPNFEPSRLIDGDPATAWNDESLRGAGAWLEFRFEQPVSPAAMVVTNLPDPARFARNFRIRNIEVTSDRGDSKLFTLEDAIGAQTVAVDLEDVQVIRIDVLSTYEAREAAGPPFEELAVAEVAFFAGASPAPPEASGWAVFSVAASEAAEFRDAAWHDGTFLIAGNRVGKAVAWTSADGQDWGQHEVDPDGFSEVRAVVAAPPGFVAIGSRLASIDGIPDATVVYESADGRSWELTATIADAVLSSLTAAPDGTVLAAGNSNQIWRRGVDGRWAPTGAPNPGPKGIVYDVLAADGGYVALAMDQSGASTIYRADSLDLWGRVGPAGDHAHNLAPCDGICLLSVTEGTARLLTSSNGSQFRVSDLPLPAGATAASAIRAYVDPDTGLGAVVGESWSGGEIGRNRAAIWLKGRSLAFEPVEAPDLFPVGSHADAVTAGAGKIVVAGATGPQTPNSLLGVWVYQP